MNAQQLQSELLLITQWCEENNIIINLDKTVVIHYGKNSAKVGLRLPIVTKGFS